VHEFLVVAVVGKHGMGADTHITMHQREDVVYRHSYPHLVPLGANLRFGMAKIVDHHLRVP
jgi:hypothetical protein